MKLIEIIEKIATNLKTTYDNTIFDHSGNKGDSREKAVIDFLSKVLPNKYGFKSGEVFDEKNGNSGQVDIIIYDNLFSTIYNDGSGKILAPVDSTYGIISVKSIMGTGELDEMIRGIQKYDSLKRTKPKEKACYITPYLCIEGTDNINVSSSYQHNINCIFAYKNTVKEETILKKIEESKCIDFLIVPNKIFAMGRQTINQNMSFNGKRLQKGLLKPTDKAIAMFIISLQAYLNNNQLVASNNVDILSKLFNM